MTDEEKVAQVRHEFEAGALPPLGEPHKEVWLVQAWDAPEDAYRHIDEMVAIDAGENEYYDKEIL
jgi:hypothetical protein